MEEIHEKNSNPQLKKKHPSYKNQICRLKGRKNRKRLIITAVFFLLLSLRYVEATRPWGEYEAVSRIRVRRGSPFGPAAEDAVWNLANNPRVLRRVCRENNLTVEASEKLQNGGLRIEQDDKTGIISILYTGKDKSGAVQIVNSIADILTTSVNGSASPYTQRYRDTIEKRLREVEEDIALLEAEEKSALPYRGDTAPQEFELLLSHRIAELKRKIVTIDFETDLLEQNAAISAQRVLEKKQLKAVLQNILAILKHCKNDNMSASMTTAAVRQQYKEITMNLAILHAVKSALEQEYETLKMITREEAPILVIQERAVYQNKLPLLSKENLSRVKSECGGLLDTLFSHMED